MSIIDEQKKKNDPRTIPTIADIGQLTEQIKPAPVPTEAPVAEPVVEEQAAPVEEEGAIVPEEEVTIPEPGVEAQYPDIDFRELQQHGTFPKAPGTDTSESLLPDTSIFKPESLLTGDRFPTFYELDAYEQNFRNSYSLPKYDVTDPAAQQANNWAKELLERMRQGEVSQQTDFTKPNLDSNRKSFWETTLGRSLSSWGSLFPDEDSKTIKLVNPLTTPLSETSFGDFGKGILGGANYMLNFLGNAITGGATDIYNLTTGNRNPESSEPNILQAIKGRDYSFTLEQSPARPLSVGQYEKDRPETYDDLYRRGLIYANPLVQIPVRATQALRGDSGSDKLPNPFDLFLNKKDADTWLERSLGTYEFLTGLTLDGVIGMPQDALMTGIAKGGKAAAGSADEVAETVLRALPGSPDAPRLPGSPDVPRLPGAPPGTDLGTDAFDFKAYPDFQEAELIDVPALPGGLQTAPSAVPRIMLPVETPGIQKTADIQQVISESLRTPDSLQPKPQLALPPAKDLPPEIWTTTPEKIIKSLELPNTIPEVPEFATDIVRRTNSELTDLAIETGDLAPRLTPLSDTEIDVMRMTYGDKYSRMGVNLMQYRFGDLQDLDVQRLVKDIVWSKLVEPDLIPPVVAIAKANLPEALRASDNVLVGKFLQSERIVNNLANEVSELQLKIAQSEQALARNLDYIDSTVDAGRKNLFQNFETPTIDPLLNPVIPRNDKLAQFLNSQVFYHGTKADIDLTVINPLEGAARSELGVGIHLTHDPEVAKNYADAIVGRNVPPVEGRQYTDLGRVYETRLNVQSPLSATVSLEPEARLGILNAIDSLKQNPSVPKPLIDTLKRAANNPKVTYEQFMNKIDESFQKYVGEVAEGDILSFQRNVSAELRKNGYDSIFFQTKYGKDKKDYLQVMLLGNTENNSFRGVLPPRLRSTSNIISNARGRYNADSIAEQVFKKSTFAKSNKEDSAVFLQTQMTNELKKAQKGLSNNLDNFTEKMVKLEDELRDMKAEEVSITERRLMENYRKQNEDLVKHYNTPEEGLC